MTRRTRLLVIGPLLLMTACGSCAREDTAPMAAPTPNTLPGADPYPADLAQRLATRLAALGPDYVPRTHHKGPDGAPTYVNRLVLETSPYLLQHAHNPVNWFPWSEEAFALAAALDRPVLLSVGYSTCHWCHVMERESFEDEAIAAYINAHFIAIKVDREERPDVDGVYMNAVQLMTGRGGWPMTVVLTPDRRPFFGGTYFPARDGDRGARTGFLTILQKLSDAYATRRDEVVASATQLSQALARMNGGPAQEGLPEAEALGAAARQLVQRFDPVHGGFGRAPKFPRPSTFALLLRYARRADDAGARRVVTHSLRKMGDGGIYDHLAGGFARYSTDNEWLVPHFEKMLYDNAQLVAAYVETWQASGDDYYRAKAEDVLQYVLREMTDPKGGGFYSATDADSEGEEGKFFVWTPAELEAALGAEDAKVAAAYWGVTAAGNFEGKNILHRGRPALAVAAELGLAPEALQARMTKIRARLYDVRKGRIPPLLDDKILTEWNGQMISAFARAGLAFGEPRYVEAAARAARFVQSELTDDGRLRRAFRAGESRHGAVLEDYAFFTAALLDLFEATANRAWLEAARDLQTQLDAHYWDHAAGGYFTTPDDGEALLVREKPSYDGAQPSGNSVAALNLLRFAELFDDAGHKERAMRILQWQKKNLSDGAQANPLLAAALDAYLFEAQQIVLITTDDDDGAALKAVLRKAFLPNASLVIGPRETVEGLKDLVPWVEGKVARGDRATAYVCRGYFCDKPTSDPQELTAQLQRFDRLEAEPLIVPGQ